RGARHARVHLDDHHAAVDRVDTELDVGTTGFHTDLAQHRQGGAAHDLVFLAGQGLGRSHGAGVTAMHTHGVEVLGRGADAAALRLDAQPRPLVFLAAALRLVDQPLLGPREIQTAGAGFLDRFTVVGDTAASATHGEGGTDDAGEA